MDIFTLDNLASLGTLTILEIVLGIDNIVFLALLVSKLPKPMQRKARLIGLTLAMVFRVILLSFISWIMLLKDPIFMGFSGKDMILIGGGGFLIWKSMAEVLELVKFTNKPQKAVSPKEKFASVIVQIIFIDLVFSLDSIITAVGISRNLPIMITAIMIAIVFMMFATAAVGAFIERHPSVKILALSFLLLVGGILLVEGFGQHVSHAYIYAAMGFASFVELLNIQFRRAHHKHAIE